MMLIGITAFAQIEIVENFDGLSNNGVPTGWTETNFGATANFTCDGSEYAMGTAFTGAGSETLSTPNYSAISNGTDLTVSFSYNIFEQTSQFPPVAYTGPASGWGSIAVEYTTDGTTWNPLTTITDSDFTFVDNQTCGTVNVNAGTIANASDFQARFVVTASTISTFVLWVVIDNVSLTQVADAVPNCDAVLTSPLNASNTAETDATLTWSRATGLATGYTLSVGTTSGGTDVVNAVDVTGTSYDVTGLAYETDYYVNIVPYNAIGSATSCTEEMFTTRVEPIDGTSCSKPIAVSTFPFLHQDDTANYEDNIDVSPCSNTYMSGNEVFYEITPATDMSINISVTNILPATGSRAAIHVVEGCIDTATECLGYVGAYSAPSGGVADERTLNDIVLSAGTTYYVVLSTSNNSATFSYNLFIEQNPCINPTFGELTPVADCGNNQFTVDVDINYLGDATTLTLSDNMGNTYEDISATGVVSAGPYASGSTVEFTVTNDDEASCSATASAYFYCPPANDECSSSIVLTVNADDTCTNMLSASNAGATESTSDTVTCGNNTNDVWFHFVATQESMVVEYSNVTAVIGTGGTIQATEFYEGTCGSLTSISCTTGNYMTYTGLTIGNTYYLRNVSNNSGEYAQSFDICVRELSSPPANDECSSATALTAPTADNALETISGTTVGALPSADNACNTSGYGDVWYVVNPTVDGIYQFSIAENPTGQTGSVYFSVYEGICGSLTEKSTSCNSSSDFIISLSSSSTYYVMVQTALTYPGITFDLDLTKLPDAVAHSDCSSALAFNESPDATGANKITGNINVTDVVYYSPEGCASSTNETVWYEFTPTKTGTYHFELVRTSGTSYYTVYSSNDCSSDLEYLGGEINSCFESGSDSGPVEAGKTYLVSIQASSAAEFTFNAYPDETLDINDVNFEGFTYYPNPVKNTLTLEARNAISSISIRNIVGQEVKRVVPNSIKSMVDMNNLKDGVYFVSVKIDASVKTFKVIKK
ncbi:hypothetical protein PW52_04070 [Tamlana sedimentorum]|uniref:Fibronectin type-III domain-containing protein n=2 Tax=Neotamlana sedimentorum TaxID=1435349 RepID=A0A0D7WGF8_9FLAO|nr:hypothetical protein PW52_04070 [Tamlana sedimentorum]